MLPSMVPKRCKKKQKYKFLSELDPTAAFDMVHDPVVALETLVSLGFQRVLTSGCDTSALEGLPLIKRLIDQVCLNYMYAYMFVCNHMEIFLSPPGLWLNRLKGELPSCQVSTLAFSLYAFFFMFSLVAYLCFFNTGGGITERNLQRILEGSGAQEFHGSARSSKDSAMKFR